MNTLCPPLALRQRAPQFNNSFKTNFSMQQKRNWNSYMGERAPMRTRTGRYYYFHLFVTWPAFAAYMDFIQPHYVFWKPFKE